MAEQARDEIKRRQDPQPGSNRPDITPHSLRVIQGMMQASNKEVRDMNNAKRNGASAVPSLAYDGGNIYVPMDAHDEMVEWMTRHMGWNVRHQFDNRPKHPDHAIVRERKTLHGFGTCMQSIELRDGADPLPTAVTADTRVRWCWRTRDIRTARDYLHQQGTLVGELYIGPGEHLYFDFRAAGAGVLLTAQEDANVAEDSPRFVPSWNRIGVADLRSAREWYESYVGMSLLTDCSEDGYVVMGLNLEHHPNEKSMWVLEQNAANVSSGQLNGAARPNNVVHDKRQFSDYYFYLRSEGIIVSDILGYPPIDGYSWFHFYDLDGNRFDVYRY